MKIGLVNIEPKIQNTAYMQISYYHKQQGDQVEWYSPLYHKNYDKIYCSSIFTFTNKKQVPKNTIVGGTGYDVKSKLQTEIEESNLDYSIYPNCTRSFLWFSRGCNNHCWFCIVQEKEGKNHAVKHKNLNPNGKNIAVMDNSYFEGSEWREGLEFLNSTNQPLEFYGVNARTFKIEHAEALFKLKRSFILHCAWDNPNESIIQYLNFMAQFISKRRIRVYYLTVGNEEADTYRSDELFKNGFDAFCMPYNKSDPYQKARARWENYKAIRKSVSWKEYHYGSWQSIVKSEVVGEK